MDPLIGEIKIFAGSFAPNGWFTCEGQTLAINQYQAFFSIIGTTYGGDGVTTFKLPDLRSAFPTQVSNIRGGNYTPYTLGQFGGQQTATLTPQQMPAHTHNININTEAPSVGLGSDAYLGFNADSTEGTPIPFYSDKATAGAVLNSGSLTPAGGSQPVNITPPFVAMQFIIAWNGVYPSRP